MVLKKLAVGLACVGMVLFSTVPVHAADDVEVPHTHLFISTGTKFSAILPGTYDASGHTVILMQIYKCDCGVERAIEYGRTSEAHSPVFTSASSSHTIPDYHEFRGKCDCGFTTIAIKYCNGC